jgi:hypothetical protein
MFVHFALGSGCFSRADDPDAFASLGGYHRFLAQYWSGLFSGPTLASDGGREKCCYSVSDQMPL